MKNHFIIAYFGNKRNEVERLYEAIKDDLKDVETIYEPYCGSSALSFYIASLNPGKFKYVLNDKNKNLIELYKILNDDEKIKKFENKIYEMMTPYPTREKYKEIIDKDDIYGYYIKNKFYNIRPGLYPDPSIKRSQCFVKKIKEKSLNIIKCPVVDFVRKEKIKFSAIDAIDIIEKNKDQKNVYMFFDPPYLSSCNSYYDGHNKIKGKNIYELFARNPQYCKFKYSFIINKNWLNDLIFSEKPLFKIIEYEKKYSNHKKKKAIHMIVTKK